MKYHDARHAAILDGPDRSAVKRPSQHKRYKLECFWGGGIFTPRWGTTGRYTTAESAIQGLEAHARKGSDFYRELKVVDTATGEVLREWKQAVPP